MSTPHELIQQAIDKIDGKRKKRRVQLAFDRDPLHFTKVLIDDFDNAQDADCDEISDYIEGYSTEIDPEKLSKWIELLVKLLPLILRFL